MGLTTTCQQVSPAATSSSHWNEIKLLIVLMLNVVYQLTFITMIIKVITMEQMFSRSHLTSLANWENSSCSILDQPQLLTEFFRPPENSVYVYARNSNSCFSPISQNTLEQLSWIKINPENLERSWSNTPNSLIESWFTKACVIFICATFHLYSASQTAWVVEW